MDIFLNHAAKRLLLLLPLSFLGGCVAAPPYYGVPYDAPAAYGPAYGGSPVYYGYPRWYVEPPASLNFSFGYWGGRRGHHGHQHHPRHQHRHGR